MYLPGPDSTPRPGPGGNIIRDLGGAQLPELGGLPPARRRLSSRLRLRQVGSKDNSTCSPVHKFPVSCLTTPMPTCMAPSSASFLLPRRKAIFGAKRFFDCVHSDGGHPPSPSAAIGHADCHEPGRTRTGYVRVHIPPPAVARLTLFGSIRCSGLRWVSIVS